MQNLAQIIDAISRETHAGTSKSHKKQWGQFFTPYRVAQFMSRLPAQDVNDRDVRILDPGAGTGILGIAAGIEALRRGAAKVTVVCVEEEPGARAGLALAQSAAAKVYGERLNIEVMAEDFLSLGEPLLSGRVLKADFDIAISNPPYFKMSPSKPHGGDAPNAYARFMEVAAALLRAGGDLVFIVPRSFTAGYYFRRFRRRISSSLQLALVHVFESRSKAFKKDDVLQENIIVHYRKERSDDSPVTISESTCPETLDSSTTSAVPRAIVITRPESDCVINLPTSADDLEVLRRVNSWPCRLAGLGLSISTGPVVPFRTDAMVFEPGVEGTVPLLWLHHVSVGNVSWPLPSFRKEQSIRADADEKLLVPNETYVLLRRFSAKEDPRRLTAGVITGGTLPGDVLGLENHLNYIHCRGKGLEIDMAYGLATLFTLRLVDRYFAISNGNTQVSATEIRQLPLPRGDALAAVGRLSRDLGLGVVYDEPAFQERVLSLLP
jgi:adenine-specific DNA-methyltransferase